MKKRICMVLVMIFFTFFTGCQSSKTSLSVNSDTQPTETDEPDMTDEDGDLDMIDFTEPTSPPIYQSLWRSEDGAIEFTIESQAMNPFSILDPRAGAYGTYTYKDEIYEIDVRFYSDSLDDESTDDDSDAYVDIRTIEFFREPAVAVILEGNISIDPINDSFTVTQAQDYEEDEFAQMYQKGDKVTIYRVKDLGVRLF